MDIDEIEATKILTGRHKRVNIVKKYREALTLGVKENKWEKMIKYDETYKIYELRGMKPMSRSWLQTCQMLYRRLPNKEGEDGAK